MREDMVRTRTLREHFFRRFFDSDTLSLEAETQTTVIRALSTCAVPGLMVVFWLMPHNVNRPFWAVAADRYFFVLYSFVAMGMVATFEWEMLFPDRTDFLILLPLPLRRGELFVAKGRALLVFLALFLCAANLFAMITFPALSTPKGGIYLYTVWAHFVAVAMAGSFAAMSMLAVAGISMCLLPLRWFRLISSVIQSLSITVLLLLMLLFPLASSHLPMLLESGAGVSRWIPPIWFLGLYERLMLGASAPAGCGTLADIGMWATAAAVIVAVAIYPMAWARQKKRALEGTLQTTGQRRSWTAALLHRALLKRAQQRAIFHFIGQTMARNARYQIYLAIYAGVGLAMALCSVVTLKAGARSGAGLGLSNLGLHAALPLLLFWMVSGIRAAFAFPVDMRARWIFPISLPDPGRDAKAAKTWVLLCCGALTCTMLALLTAAGWGVRELAVQAIWGFGLSLLLADLFFVGRTQIPFTRPRMPGRASLPIVFTLYTAVFPALVLSSMQVERSAETRLRVVLWMVAAIVATHVLLMGIDKLAQRGIIGGFPEDEEDDGPQTLGLFQ